MAEPNAAATGDTDTDPIVSRSRLLTAIAAVDSRALEETIVSIPEELHLQLESELRAAKAVVESLAKQSALEAELEKAKAKGVELQGALDAESARLKQVETAAGGSAAQASAVQAQLKSDLRAARGQDVPHDHEVKAIAQETRINELQASVASLQTQLRQSEMKGQQQLLELANAKEAVGPTLKAMKHVEEELEHTKRLLKTSDASNAQLTTQLAALQQRASGIAIGETRPFKPPRPGVSSSSAASPSKGAPRVAEDGGEGGEGVAAGEGDGVPTDAAAPQFDAAETEAEEPLPGSLDECQKDLRHERARLRMLRSENLALRDEMETQLERQRRGADRGLREMQTEFARLHRNAAEMREAVNAAESRSQGEANFRRRAEQGWLKAQEELEKTQSELQNSRVQCGELEGRLKAAEQLSADLIAARKTINALQGKAAADEARLQELMDSQRLNSQHVAVAMGHAQQHAASEYERLQAEHEQRHQHTASQANWWRQRAEKSHNRCAASAAALAAARSSLESLLSRLVSATSMADLADQSRLLFEVKAALIDIEERLRRPDSAGGAPPDGAGRGGGKPTKKGNQAVGPGAGAGGAGAGGGGGGGLGGGGFGAGGGAGAGGLCSFSPFGGGFPSAGGFPPPLPGIGQPFSQALGYGGGGFGGGGFGGIPGLGGAFGGFGGAGGGFDPSKLQQPAPAPPQAGGAAGKGGKGGKDGGAAGEAKVGVAPKTRIPPPGTTAAVGRQGAPSRRPTAGGGDQKQQSGKGGPPAAEGGGAPVTGGGGAPPPYPLPLPGFGPGGVGGPPPPEPLSELDQLHQAGDRKFGKGNSKLPGGRPAVRTGASRAGGPRPAAERGVSFQQ